MKTYPLLQSQMGIFMECLKNPTSTQYNVPISSTLPKAIDLDRLEKALQQIIRVRKEVRTRFIIVDGEPRQYCDENMVIPIQRKKMTDSEVEHYIAHDFVRPYDILSGEPLIRIEIIEGEKNNYILFDYQHTVGDGVTMAPNLTQIDLPAAYNGEELIPNEYGMYEYALDEEAALKSEQYEKAKQYYMEKFGDTDLVTLADSMENRLGLMVRESSFISQETVDNWCKEQGTQSNLLFMAAFSLVLSKLTHQSEVAYYSINHGRMDKRLRNVYGMFVKSVPILAKVSGQQPVMDFIKTFRTELMSSIRYGIYPFNHFCSDLHQEPKISFGFQGIAMQEYFDLEGEHCIPVQISKGMIDDDMSCVIYLKKGDYEIRMESSDALNSAETLRMVANCVKASIEYIMAHPDCVLSDIKMLNEQEEKDILKLSKGKTLKVDAKTTFPSLFIEQAAKHADANAVVDEQGTYTYAELNKLSGALALKLRKLGVGSPKVHSPFVSIMLGYQKEFLVAAIGIEKAGGAYVPLDYDYPNDRLLYMLEDSESQVLITSHAIFNEKTAQGDNFTAKNILFIEDFLESVKAESGKAEFDTVNFATPDGLAYMIYTSGSTGKPKGVMIPHKAKANFVQFIAKEWGHTAKSRICCHSSFSFDASVEDLYPVLTVGGTLYTVPKEARKDLVMLHDFIVDNGITGGCYTTQLGQMLLQLFPDLPVDYLVVGGEKMTTNPDCNCRLINTYGPTEFTVDATFYDVEKGKEYKNIPIGRPLYNLSAYVVDQFGHVLPQGTAGELCMAGPQIAAGYWKREDLTAEKFADCPFAKGKMYHTGDLVRYNKEGQIEYLGRIDSQVKLRGFRIELGEIESLIAAYPDILMESVQVKEIGGVQHLCAYYTATKQIDADELKEYLSEQLTDYMVPTAYMQLDRMPLTPNGKVNTKALPMPNVQSEDLVAPTTQTEKKLFQLAAEMLKHENFGITSDLFTMGMTSITGMRFAVNLYNEFGVQVTIRDVMQNPTIQLLAALIDNKQQEEALSAATANAELWPQGKHYYYPITENQRGVFLDWELHPDTTQYNVPEVHVFRGGDAERLCNALKTVVNAHPYLKTRFVQHEGDVMQIRRDEEEPVIVYEVLKEQPDRAFFQSRVRPFDLYHDTLYHLEVYAYGADVYLLMDIHHTIYDGASSLFLLSDIQKAYQGETVEEESYTAFDFALDEYRFIKSPEYAEAETYFKNLLDGKETTVFPSYPSDKDNCEETSMSITVDNAEIAAFCKKNGLNPNSYFLAVVMHVLQTTTWEDDVVLTSITNGRNDPRTMGIMGMFVKTIPAVWSADNAKASVTDAVNSLQQQLAETQSRDFYPFTKMVELYGLRPEIMYAYQPAEGIALDDDDNMTLALNQIKVPLDINVMPQGDQYTIILEYDKERYARKQIESLMMMFRQVAETACHAETMSDILLLNAEQTADIIRQSVQQKSFPNLHCFVVDCFGRLLPQGSEGELCVAGVQAGSSYGQLPDMTDEVLTDCPFVTDEATGRPLRMYHTGDICRWNEQGNLEYIGRKDHLVKLHGVRIETSEIESLAMKVEGVHTAVAEVREVGSSPALILYYVLDEGATLTEEQLRNALDASTLADFMKPTVYMQLDEMPMTTDGKVDYKKLPTPSAETGKIVEASSETEAQILAIATELLGGAQIGVTTNLITAGMTSLTAMRMSAVIKQKTQFYIPVKELMLHPTVREIASLSSTGASKEEKQKTHAKQEYYPITENQRGVYIDWELNSDALQYNIPEVVPMDGYTAEQINDALLKVVEAHPYLKTRLVKKDGDVMQQRRDDAPVNITMTKLDYEPTIEDFKQRVKPFNLLKEDLYRLEIIQSPSKCFLFVDIHHVINDGSSRLVFSQALAQALNGEAVEPENYTAFDYALDEKENLEGASFQEAETYFDGLLSGQESTVYPHSAESTEGKGLGTFEFTVEGKDIDTFCREIGVTSNAYFATMFSQLLHRVTREESVLFTTIDNGRSDMNLMQSIGMFVKTLPVTSIQNFKDADKATLTDAVKQMHEQLTKTRSFGFYPFTRMSERHGIQPEIMYVYHGTISAQNAENQKDEEVTLDLDTAKLPLTVTVYSKGDDTYTVMLEYNLTLYSTADMKVLADMLVAACQSTANARSLADIRLMTDDEQKAMVTYSKGKDMDVDITKTFAQVFEERAKLVPDNIAVADKNSQLTYQQMSHYSDVLAHQLIEAGVKPNDFVCVMLDRFKEFPLSVLAIHKAGAAYTPMDYEYPNERLQYMLENSESKVLITSHQVLESKLAEGNFNTGNAKIIFIEDIDFNVAADAINLTTPDNLAYMIYTSGSTGKPKGAMLHQAGLWNFINIVIDMEKLTADDRIEGHRSFSFDAHIEDMYPILTLGGSFHIMPSEIRKDVAAMRDFLFEHKITGGGYSTAIAAMLLNTYDDLPVRFITAGGEKLSGVYSDHIEIINVYGPTECTDDTSYYTIAPGISIENIPIGKPVANSWNFIVDTAGHLVPRGVVGELCIAGIPVGRGYWRLPERSAESFVDCPFVTEDRWGRKVRMYHTGDLCRYNEQGDLEYMGRIDFQVKLRGFRIELGEIESKVLQIEGVLQAAAEVKKIIGTDHLVLYYTRSEDSAISDEDIRKALQQSALAEYMVPDTYVQMDVMPMTPNGKINRKALPIPQIKAAEIVAPANETEQQLLDMAIELLKHDQFGVTTNLITVGMTSITAMRISAMIGSKYQKNVPTKSILENPTLRHIAAIIDGNEEVKGTQIAHIHEYREYYPITENQRGVYIAWELNRETTQYNIPQLRKYSGINADELQAALIEVVNAHPILKARMAIVDGDVMQQRRDDAEAVVSVTQLEKAPTKEFFQTRVRPFDLQNEDLYRIEIYQHGADVYLFMDFHHIISDGVSNIVFDNDLQQLLYGATDEDKKIERETYTAFDRALDEQEMRESDMYPAAEKYFDTLLESFEIASYPASRQPDKAEPVPAVVSAVVDGDTVNNFCTSHGVTANSFFMTAVTQVLHRILREDDLMMSAISTGRFTPEMQNTIGFYVQTLPIVTHSSNVSVTDAVNAMQQQYIDTQSNSIFSYTKAVEKYGCRAEILFAFQAVLNASDDEMLNDSEENIPLQLDTVKMPILISVVNDKAGYRIDLDYDASRYNQADMSRFANAVKHFLENAPSLADNSVNSVPLTSKQDEQELLALGKGETLDFDKSLTLVDIIRRQVAATPDATAIVCRDKHLTYRELDELTDRLASHLQQMGVKPEQAIGVMIDRSELMAVYPIAIMKAGAAYMPLDSHFPEERLQFMCEDAGVSLILADDGIVSEAMPHYTGKTFTASELATLPEVTEKPVAAITPDNMFVILYTSGSTGKPKGCMLEHGNIVNFCYWYTKEFNVTKEDRAVAYANFGFDAHMMDLYPALSVGASVYIIPSELRMDLMAMNKYMEEQQLTIAFMTTQIGYMFATSIENHSLRLLSVGGEKLQPLKKPRFRFYNGYGPTECTLYSTCYNITKDYNSSLIGRPLANYQLRIVDKHMNLVPRGVPGELVVMGAGVGRGYLNRPDMNAEKFITMNKQRAYRTGDLVRWSEDGHIDYIGRIDGQVKLRGLRIELGEIESRVAEYEAVKQVCVDVKEIGSVQNLVCYYVEKEGHHVQEEELKAWIGETLTAFMVPEFYVKMDKFPFTPNGKVNRRELPLPEAKAVEIVAPETETEHKLYDIAVEMLNSEQIGVTTSLISYGLTSLTAMRLSALLQQRISVAIPVAELLSHPTIREIATLIDSGQVKSAKVADIFTKRAPQADQANTASKGNPLQPKGNPLQSKGNPLQPKANPMQPKSNPMQPKSNPMQPKNNPMQSKSNPMQPKNNPFNNNKK